MTRTSHRILAIGYGLDPTFRHTLSAIATTGSACDVLDLHDLMTDSQESVLVTKNSVENVGPDYRNYRFADYDAIYCRIYELYSSSADRREQLAQRNRVVRRLSASISLLNGFVVNRPMHGFDNTCKPFQLIRLRDSGFTIPSSVVTNNPTGRSTAAIHDGEWVYKSVSSHRSIVSPVNPGDSRRLQDLPVCPVLFQKRIDGPDVRLHLVGERTISLQIDNASDVDYRYAANRANLKYQEIAEPSEIALACRTYAASTGLYMIGFDFKIDQQGVWYCLEANPMPGYEGYDARTGGKISDALVDLLTEKRK